jgi:hypothetical protein
MYERFTDRSRKVMQLAQLECERLGMNMLVRSICCWA